MIKENVQNSIDPTEVYLLSKYYIFPGEQVLEDDRTDKIDNAEVIKSLTEGGSTLTTVEAKDDASKAKDKKHSTKHKEKDRSRDRSKNRRSTKEKSHRSHRSSSRDRGRER